VEVWRQLRRSSAGPAAAAVDGSSSQGKPPQLADRYRYADASTAGSMSPQSANQCAECVSCKRRSWEQIAVRLWHVSTCVPLLQRVNQCVVWACSYVERICLGRHVLLSLVAEQIDLRLCFLRLRRLLPQPTWSHHPVVPTQALRKLDCHRRCTSSSRTARHQRR
jgi:hypothetical protein